MPSGPDERPGCSSMPIIVALEMELYAQPALPDRHLCPREIGLAGDARFAIEDDSADHAKSRLKGEPDARDVLVRDA